MLVSFTAVVEAAITAALVYPITPLASPFSLTNGDRYARQIRIRAEWSEPLLLRNLVQYSDNYFDLAPGESRTIEADVFFSKRGSEPIFGRLIVVMPMRLALSVRKPTLGHPSRNLAGRPTIRICATALNHVGLLLICCFGWRPSP